MTEKTGRPAGFAARAVPLPRGGHMVRSIEERLARLEAIEDIKALKARYCALCDADYEPDGLAALFLPDAVWESETFGRYEGREAIRTFFRGVSSDIRFA